METAGTPSLKFKPGSQQALGPAQMPRARDSTRRRVPPLHLLHQPHAGDLDLGGWCRASQSRPAYLEDRRQVLGHFQSLSLHRVDHILHPGAGAAMGQGGTVAIRAGDSKTAPDVADWHRAPQAAPAGPGWGEGRRHAEAGPSCHLAAEAETQPGEREAGARAAPGLFFFFFFPRSRLSPPGSTSTPSGFPFLFSLSPDSSAATWASRDSSLPRHVTTAGGRGGGTHGSLLTPARPPEAPERVRLRNGRGRRSSRPPGSALWVQPWRPAGGGFLSPLCPAPTLPINGP